MPVRSLSSPVLTWPRREAVEEALRAWSDDLTHSRADVLRVGFFGSYARGDAGVGSDLDVLVVVSHSDEPPLRRPLAFDTVTGFPVPVDLLVYTADEWRRAQGGGDPFARRLAAEVVWVAPART
jgi:predicted nucleotidyltransferase